MWFLLLVALALAGDVRALERRLTDPDEQVRWHAALELSTLGPDALPALDAVRKLLGGTSLDKRGACFVLEALGPAGAVAAPEVAPLLAEDEVDSYAWRALGAMGAAALEPTRPYVTSGSASTRERAIVALSRLGPAAMPAFGDIASQIDHPNAVVRETAIKALGTIGDGGPAPDPALVDELLRRLERGPLEERIGAAYTLTRLRAPPDRVVPLLREALRAPEDDYPGWWLRTGAADALLYLGPDGAAAVPELAEVARVRYATIDGKTAMKAIRAMGPAAAPAVVPFAIRIVDEAQSLPVEAPDQGHRGLTARYLAWRLHHEQLGEVCAIVEGLGSAGADVAPALERLLAVRPDLDGGVCGAALRAVR